LCIVFCWKKQTHSLSTSTLFSAIEVATRNSVNPKTLVDTMHPRLRPKSEKKREKKHVGRLKYKRRLVYEPRSSSSHHASHFTPRNLRSTPGILSFRAPSQDLTRPVKLQECLYMRHIHTDYPSKQSLEASRRYSCLQQRNQNHHKPNHISIKGVTIRGARRMHSQTISRSTQCPPLWSTLSRNDNTIQYR
jgi:hypothetical protein